MFFLIKVNKQFFSNTSVLNKIWIDEDDFTWLKGISKPFKKRKKHFYYKKNTFNKNKYFKKNIGRFFYKKRKNYKFNKKRLFENKNNWFFNNPLQSKHVYIIDDFLKTSKGVYYFYFKDKAFKKRKNSKWIYPYFNKYFFSPKFLLKKLKKNLTNIGFIVKKRIFIILPIWSKIFFKKPRNWSKAIISGFKTYDFYVKYRKQYSRFFIKTWKIKRFKRRLRHLKIKINKNIFSNLLIFSRDIHFTEVFFFRLWSRDHWVIYVRPFVDFLVDYSRKLEEERLKKKLPPLEPPDFEVYGDIFDAIIEASKNSVFFVDFLNKIDWCAKFDIICDKNWKVWADVNRLSLGKFRKKKRKQQFFYNIKRRFRWLNWHSFNRKYTYYSFWVKKKIIRQTWFRKYFIKNIKVNSDRNYSSFFFF